MEVFFAKFSFKLQSMVKSLLLVLLKKGKQVKVNLGRKWQIEKVEKIENGYAMKLKRVIKELGVDGVGDLH